MGVNPGGSIVLAGARILGVLVLLAAPSAALTLQLQDAEIADRVVRLGDIASITGLPADQADSLARAVVAFAPMPGTSRPVPIQTIRMRVLSEGFLPGEIRMVGASAPVVRRRGQRIEPAVLERAVLDELSRMVDESTALQVTRIPATGILPVGDARITVQAPARMERNFYVPVTVAVGDEQTTVQVSVTATQLVAVLTATRRIERGEVLGAGDVVVRSVNRFDAPRGALVALPDVLGSAAVRPILPGMVLAEGMIEKPSAVQRGERVRLVSALGSLEVSVAAEALESGAHGQRIRVRNTETRRIITARVRGAGEVIIDGF